MRLNLQLPRRQMLQGMVAAGIATAGTLLGVRGAGAHSLPPGAWQAEAYADAIETGNRMTRVTFATPHVPGPGRLLMVQADNWLKAMQVSYEEDPEETRAVMALYGPANVINYDDHVWSTYSIGAWLGIKDGANFATRNVFLEDLQPLQARHVIPLT